MHPCINIASVQMERIRKQVAIGLYVANGSYVPKIHYEV